MLLPYYSENHLFEIGIDEAGRGPLFGRLYVAAVVCPKDILPNESIDTINKTRRKRGDITWSDIKDSKKIKNRKHMSLCVDFIKQNARAFAIHYIEHQRIDEINIRQAVLEGMHKCIRDILEQLKHIQCMDVFLLVDGNDFKPFAMYDEKTDRMEILPYTTIEGGDDRYLAIAAASILAKYTRDEYILNLCQEHPELIERYSLNTNMGYGTKKHLQGIQQFGLFDGHRLSYKPCSSL
jgi:ribonuclease HII